MSEETERALIAARAEQDDLRERLMTLAAASTTLLVSPRVEDVLPATLTLAGEMVPADGYAVWRLQEGFWRIGASQGLSAGFAKLQVDPDGVPQLHPLTAPLYAEDVSYEPRLEKRHEAYRDEGIRAVLALPLTICGDASGSLVFYYRQPHHFSEVESQIAMALANLASAAITTAELYDAQQRSRSQSDFLAEAGAVLAKSLDYHATLTRVAQLAVPHFADWCAVDLVNEIGTVDRLAVAYANPERAEMIRKFSEQFPPGPDTRVGARAVIRTGQPAVIENITDEQMVSGMRDENLLRAGRAMGIQSFLCVPLIARGRTLGAMTFLITDSPRRYNASDLQFANDLAARAALAVDNARAYEEARRASQLKDEFLATLSHELRTPLNAILGYARMLRSGMLDGPRQARGLEILERNATSLTQIVEDVLDVSRIVSGKLALNVKPVDLPAIVAQGIATMQPAADAKGVRMIANIDASAPAVTGDPDRLQQVIWNLLSNAVKFTPAGERIEVRLELDAAHAQLIVSDTGIGIAPTFLPHIFERFRQADGRFSREHGGLGLGLSISRHIVEMHGGTIEAASEGGGRGSTFTVRLPVLRRLAGVRQERERTEPVVEGPRVGATRLDGVRIVAVDDDTDALEMLLEILEGAGAEVTTAQTAQEALEIIRQRPPQVLVCDIGMPGMDGFEFIARVRHLPVEEGGSVPAAAVTAYARSEDRTRALRAGFQMHLAKPIDPTELLVSVKALAAWNESML